MRRNKKFFAVLLLTASFSLGACNLLPTARSKDNADDSSEVMMPEAYQIYQLYLAQGGNMTYEQWLESVRGEPGEPGHSPVVTIGNDGCWYIDGKTTNIEARGDQGEKGNQGEKGDKGDQGEKGDTGKTAYEQYIEAHPDYNKTEAEWLDDLLNGRLGTQIAHTVSFNTGEGSAVADQTILHGEKVSKPADPTRPGYTFEGWTYLGEEWSFAGHVVTNDMVLTAVWKAIDYTATFLNDDGTVLDLQENVHYGDQLVYQGADPEKPNPEDHYLYTFTGWDKALTVDGDMVFTAQYNKEYAPYEERYLDAEGNMIYNRFFMEDNGTTLMFNNKAVEKEGNRYYLEAEDAILSSGLGVYLGAGHGGAAVGNLDGGRSMKYQFTLNEKATASLYTTVSNTYSRFNELMTITINGNEMTIDDDVQAPGTHMWDDYQEALVGKVKLQKGENEIIVKCKCGGYNTDYVALEDLVFDITQEGIELPTKANEGTLKYQFKEWELLSSDNNVFIYSPVFIEATIGLEFNKGKVDVYHGTAKDVIVPEWWDGFCVTEIGKNSFQTTNVKTVTLPETITVIRDGAFFDVATLTTINLPNSLTRIEGYAFQGCTSLVNVSLNEGLVELGNHSFDSAGLKEIIIPSTMRTICDNAFVSVAADYVYLPATVENVQWNAFGTYVSDRTMTILCEREYRPSSYDGNWAEGNSVVWGYKGLVEENGFKFAISEIEGARTATLLSIDKTIVNVEVPATVNEVPVTAISGGVFMGNTVIKSVVIPEGITKIPARFFKGCSSLVSASIPNTVTEIGEEAFSDCKKLASFEMPDSVDTLGRFIFGGCYSLASVKLSNSLTELPDQLFWDCDNLTFVNIPEGVTHIPSRAFDNCDCLTSVVMPSTIAKIDNQAFTYSWNISIIYCSCTSAQWDALMDTYSHDYDNLYMATPYFYSETEPTEAGNYWHYVGGVPTVW